jgi:hypothetical protein
MRWHDAPRYAVQYCRADGCACCRWHPRICPIGREAAELLFRDRSKPGMLM